MKYYLILDCETATLPFVADYNEKLRSKIALARPLIYDIGWNIVDHNGKIYDRKNFLISEIFLEPAIFNTAYYREKRPLYLEKLDKGEIDLVSWNEAAEALKADMAKVDCVGAFNAFFDYKKAIAFTELYISKMQSADFSKWLNIQRIICSKMDKPYKGYKRKIDYQHFTFRDLSVPVFDLWGLACEHILNTDEYRKTARENGWIGDKYYRTNAEVTYRFITGNITFDEAHTAIDDCDIETIIFAEIVKQTANNWAKGISYFPFKIVGVVTPTTENPAE